MFTVAGQVVHMGVLIDMALQLWIRHSYVMASHVACTPLMYSDCCSVWSAPGQIVAQTALTTIQKGALMPRMALSDVSAPR